MTSNIDLILKLAMNPYVIQEVNLKRFRWLSEMRGVKFAKCKKCGAFMTDAHEWASNLKFFCDAFLYGDDDYKNQLAEYASDILFGLTECEPENDDIDIWEEWIKKSQKYQFFFTNEDLCKVYIIYSDVLVYKNKRCSCFKPYKT